MPVQQQNSSFAKKLGIRVAGANEQHMNAPVDTGNRRLPAGIRDGVARLSTMYLKDYDEKNDLKGNTFFRASATVVWPKQHNGEKVDGQITSIIIPLCDIPAKGDRKGRTFEENYFDFQNIFKLLGIAPCPHTKQTDPTGVLTEQYFLAAMAHLTDPARMRTNPVYISFSTRGWTPPATPLKPKPEEMVFETWHGLATAEQVARAFGGASGPDPSAGVTLESVAAAQPGASTPPPPRATATATQPVQNGAPTQAAPTQAAPPPQSQHQPAATTEALLSPDQPEYEDYVVSLIESAMNDVNQETEEGKQAVDTLEKLAWARGWTQEQTNAAADWAAVGDMAIHPPGGGADQQTAATTPQAAPAVTVGSKWMFAKRDKSGAKLKNAKNEEFPSAEVEVLTVDEAAQTCTVKAVKDGKPITDIRTKAPVAVKFDWLETPPLY